MTRNIPQVPRGDHPSDPDALLMVEAQKGDKASFEALLRKYFSRIFNFLYRALGSREAAEDLTQEVFIRVYRALPSYRHEAKFQTWLYVIARNLAYNELRKNKHKAFSLENVMMTDEGEVRHHFADSNAVDPYRELENKETLFLVQQAVNSLPENQKTAVILQRFEGMSYEEIAATLGCSAQAVKSLLNRAKESLKDRLSKIPEFKN